MFNETRFQERIKVYLEVATTSVLLIGLSGGLAALAAWLWHLMSGDGSVHWQIGLAVGIAGLIPLLVVSAMIWRVQLTLFGNRASAIISPPSGLASSGPGNVIQPTAGDAATPPSQGLGGASGLASSGPGNVIQPTAGDAATPPGQGLGGA